MPPKTPQQIFEELTHSLPRFEDGRVDYTNARKAPIMNAIVYCDGQILILKRSQKVLAYKGMWNGIAGFIDVLRPIEEIAAQELAEEVGVTAGSLTKLEVAQPFEVNDPAISRIWVVYPILAVVSQKPAIVLDREHTEYAWVQPEALENYSYAKGFDKIVSTALMLRG